jgi:hypothetical protein
VVGAFRGPEGLLRMRPRISELPHTREGQGEPRT